MDIMLWFENSYVRALAVLIGSLIVAQISIFLFERILPQLTSKTKTKLDDKLIAKLKQPLFYIIVLIGVRVSLLSIALTDTARTITNGVISSIIVLVATFALARVVDVLVTHWGKHFAAKTKSSVDDALLRLFERVSKVVVFVLGVLYVLDIWGVEVGPLLASLGIAGLAVAFALQNTLGNIFGGVSLLIDKSVKVGDRIQLETGESGIVVDVGLRSTKIRTWSNDVVVVPNGKLSESTIQNFLAGDRKARVEIDFGVAYGSAVDHVEKTVLAAIKKVNGCLKEPEPQVDFLSMGDSALLFKGKFWVEDINERYAAKLAATKNIYNALNKENIVIPFPQMDVHIMKEHEH